MGEHYALESRVGGGRKDCLFVEVGCRFDCIRGLGGWRSVRIGRCSDYRDTCFGGGKEGGELPEGERGRKRRGGEGGVVER